MHHRDAGLQAAGGHQFALGRTATHGGVILKGFSVPARVTELGRKNEFVL
jgi:hypothetical protein